MLGARFAPGTDQNREYIPAETRQYLDGAYDTLKKMLAELGVTR